jgi:ankyrin repeat protein
MLTRVDKLGYSALTYATATSSNNSSPAILNVYLDYLLTKLTANLASLVEQCILHAALNSNLACMQHLIDFVHNHPLRLTVDSVEPARGETPLTVACLNGNKIICELLVERLHASPHICNAKSWTPLLCAVKSGCWEIVEYLLSTCGSDSSDSTEKLINQVDKHGRSALILAASEGHLAILDILLEREADLAAQDKDGLSALSWSCLKGHYNAALTLLANGACVNHADNSGRTPLDLATFYGDVKLVQLLLERGALVEHVDRIGMRPLDRAIGCRNVPIVVCFLKRGAKLNPATWAMAQGKPEIIITLLNKLVEDGNTLYRVSNFIFRLKK